MHTRNAMVEVSQYSLNTIKKKNAVVRAMISLKLYENDCGFIREIEDSCGSLEVYEREVVVGEPGEQGAHEVNWPVVFSY
jgi:hypothetical protein